jgi:hypothetical protein
MRLPWGNPTTALAVSEKTKKEQNSGVLDYFHRPVLLEVETRRFGNRLFPSSGEGRRRHLLRWALSKEPISIPGPTVSSPLHLRTEIDPVSETSCFYSQEHRTTKKVQNSSNSVCYTPSSEPFKINTKKFKLSLRCMGE